MVNSLIRQFADHEKWNVVVGVNAATTNKTNFVPVQKICDFEKRKLKSYRKRARKKEKAAKKAKEGKEKEDTPCSYDLSPEVSSSHCYHMSCTV